MPTASASIGTCRGRTKQNCLTLSKSEAILRKVVETNNMVTRKSGDLLHKLLKNDIFSCHKR